VAVAVPVLTGKEMSAPARHNRPWHLLVMEFAGNTTMHGVRFLAEPTKFLTRRFAVTQILITAGVSPQKQHSDFGAVSSLFL